VEQIYYFRADQKYVTLYWSHGEALVDDTLKHLEEEFAGQFLRIHRNSLVAVIHINSLKHDDKGHYWVTLHNRPEKLEISRRHLSAVKRILQDFRGNNLKA
jgi:two-component system response regulator AlgR